MRVIETIHGENTRKYSCDSAIVLSGQFISSIHCFTNNDSFHPDDYLKKTFEEISLIPLVTSVYISKYVVEIKVVDAFSKESHTWERVQAGVSRAIQKYIASIVDMTLAPIEKEEKEEVFAIPHDFRSHRQDWRNALVIAKGLQDDFDKANGCESTGFWKHQIKTFDAAFDALEALNLPEK